MAKNTTKSILKAWKNLSASKVDDKRDYILEQILDNNYELYKLIKKQVRVIEEYHEETIGEIHKQNYINTYEDILDLIDFTMDYGIDESDALDREAGRKS